MAIKFSQFSESTSTSQVDFIVGYDGNQNVKITPSNFLAVLGDYLPLTGGTLTGNLTAPAFIKTGGTSSEFLKADGTVDTNTYLTSTTGDARYVELAGDTMTGDLTTSGNVTANQFHLAVSTQRLRVFFGTIYIESTNGARFQNTSGVLKPVTASAFNTSSDYRLKSNIEPLENAIDRLNQLEVYRFNWNDRLDEPKVDGFIAHEVSSIIPEAVQGEKDATQEDGTPDYQGIDQSKIVPLLTAALQEAVTKIGELETRIQTLEN